MKKVFNRFLTFGLSIAMLFGFITSNPLPQPTVTADAATTADSYYSGITATEDTALLGQLHDLIVSSRTKYTSYDNCRDLAKQTDPGLDGKGVMEFYTHESITGYGGTKGTWNREHVWPKNDSNGLWGTSGAGSDMHHIRPSEGMLNNSRGNKKYGEVVNGTAEYSKTTSGGNSKLGGYSNSSTFMPLDNVKGDAARIVLYVYTHYNTYTSSIFGGYATTNGSKGQASYFGNLPIRNIITASNDEEAFTLLLKWNKLDPVDDIERARNEAVYEIQGNRNPFIDHPEYASAIWGGGSVDPNPDGGGQGGGTQTTESFKPITTPVAGSDYYMAMKIGDGQYHYIDGEFNYNGYYLTTTTDISNAKKVTLEATTNGGWLMKVDGKYLELDTSDGQHANPVFNAQQTESQAWTWNAEKQIFTWDTAQWFLGTRNDKDYDTIGGCAWSYVDSDYLAVLGTYGSDTPTPPPVTDTDQEKVDAALSSLQAARTISAAGTTTLETKSGDVNLAWTKTSPATLPNGITFSGNTLTVTDDRPTTDTIITFNVTASLNGKSGTKPVTITVKGKSGGTVTPPSGDTKTLTITLDSFTLTDGYGFKTWSAGGVEGIAFIFGGSENYSASGMQFNKKQDSYYLASTTAVPGVITSVKVTNADVAGSSDRPWKLLTSTAPYSQVAGKPTNGNDQGTKTVTTSGVTWNVSGNDTYFALTLEIEGTSGAAYLDSIEVTYVADGGMHSHCRL